MSEFIIEQSQFYSTKACKTAIDNIERKYKYIDESEYFGGLVNFSTAKSEPFQRWVRYREGYSTILVNELIQRAGVDPVTHCIADPMVGSGSTIVAAKRAGIDAFGVDVNPYCAIIAGAKLASPSATTLQCVEQFIARIPEEVPQPIKRTPPLSEYFPEKNLSVLLTLRSMIDTEKNEDAHEILLACWYFIIEACSNRKKDGNGLATRPAPVTNVVQHFKDTVSAMLEDYRNHPFEATTAAHVYTGSAVRFSEYAKEFCNATAKRLGAIIFSPPYANAFDYFESYKMELLFGELYTLEDYQKHKKEQIRNYRISYGKKIETDYPIVEMICDEIDAAIPQKEALTGKRDARTRLMPNMLRGYFNDMGSVIEQLYAALDDNGSCYIVVDQSAYVGVIVPTDVLLANIAQEKGFDVESIIVCRKAATSGQQRKAYPYLGNTLRESIVCLKKHSHQ